MNFSYEEIFSMYGQYDTFVFLEFHYGSEAYQIYKSTLMGVFIYTMTERESLQEIISKDKIPRTSQYIKFKPSTLEKLTAEQHESLDKIGIQNKDIASVSASNFPKENRFIVAGEKDLPNMLEIKFDPNGIDMGRFMIGFYDSRLRSGHPLIPEEESEYYGLLLYYHPEIIQDSNFNKTISDENTGKIKESIKYYQLRAKFLKSEISEPEEIELNGILSKRTQIKVEILKKELNRSTEKLKSIASQYHSTLNTLIKICAQFDAELILPYKIPIWWDFERFIHIFLRHVKETKIGERFEGKAIFQYKLKDIRRIIKSVIENVYPEIEEHFKESPTKNYRRMGARSIYYDGIYYRIEIEPTGRLITFHPYNGDKMKVINKSEE